MESSPLSSNNCRTFHHRARGPKVFVHLFIASLAALLPQVGSWVALSKDGYVVTKDISLNNGMVVEGDMLIDGVVRSSNYTWLGPSDPDFGCSPQRSGAVRWSAAGDFESCDGERWIPVKLCDRHCGFLPPPLPAIRPFRTSNATCRLTDCPPTCVAINVFNRTAPNITEDLCNVLLAELEECRNLTAADPEVSDVVLSEYLGSELVVCQGSMEPVCRDYESDESDTYCSLAPQPANPVHESNGLLWPSFMYYFINSAISTANGTIPQVGGRIMQLEMDESFQVQKMYLHNTYISWEDRMKVFDLRYDNPQFRDDALGFLGAQIPVPFAATNVKYDEDLGTFVGPGRQSCASLLNDTNAPSLDYLKIFYNVSGWESLLWNDTGLTRRQLEMPPVQPCEGVKRFAAPWSWYNRRDPPDVRGVIDSGAYEPLVQGNSSFGKLCQFVIEAPIGFVVRIRMRRIGLAHNHSLQIYHEQAYPGEPTMELWNYTGPNVTNRTDLNGTEVMGTYVARAVSIDFRTSGVGNGTGFSLEYDFVSRQAFMLEQGNATLLQFALAVLEAQGAAMPEFGWSPLSDSRYQPVSAPPGSIDLGPVTTVESCFLCCFLGDEHDLAAEAAARYEQSKRDTSGLHPAWQAFPAVSADVGATVRPPTLTVREEEIPPLVAYAGYKAQHFVRTAFTSSLPPGSIRAPFGAPLGERPLFDVEAGQDVPEREAVGWGMESILVQSGSSFQDPSNPGWGSGWGYGTRAGMGTHWRDGDGASAAWFPSWQILVREDARFDDVQRWDFDLDSPDLPLFSFVDADRRIVMANEMALAVPCGLEINNTCAVSCGVLGTGLNILQCMNNVDRTPCLQPVVDECNNECGFTGTEQCVNTLKPLSLRVTAMNETQSTANFELAVGMNVDYNDGLTRSNDISGLGIVGVTADADGGGWVHPSTSERRFSRIDNSLLLSYRDPANDGFYDTNINGKIVSVFLSRTDVLSLQNAGLDMPIPRECHKSADECKLRTPIDDATLKGTWFNESLAPWWDTDMDKRVNWNEFGAIIKRNLRVLSLILIEELADCRVEGPASLCQMGIQAVQLDFMQRFGYVGNQPAAPGSTPESCRHLGIEQVVPLCFMSIYNVEQFRAAIEARRRNTLRSIGGRDRFNMAKIRRIQSPGGFEFASPDPTLEKVYNHNTNTLRISSDFEATGEYIRIGSSRHLNVSVCRELRLVQCYANRTSSGRFPYSDGLLSIASGWSRHVTFDDLPGREGLCNMTLCEWNASLDLKTLSHVFFNGIIKEKVPFRFDGGSMGNGTTAFAIETKRQAVLGRATVELPQVDPNHPNSANNVRVITLPDRSGKVITTGNLHDIRRLPGLRTKRPSPFRYDNESVKELDDGRSVVGSRYWYKRMLGGDSDDGRCGTFDDGTEIPCPSVHVQYDALEASGSAGDEVLVYTGDLEVQGTQLSAVQASATPQPRLDCSPMQQLCDSGRLEEETGAAEWALVPKSIAVCVGLDLQIWDDPPITCSFDDPTGCNRAAQLSICTRFPVWGPELDGRFYTLEWETVQQFQSKRVYRNAWQFAFDYSVAKITVQSCADVAQATDSPSYDWLHIYYGTDRGKQLVGKVQEYLEDNGEQRNETSLRWYALKYLDLQGVARIDIGQGPVRSFDVGSALASDSPEAFNWVWEGGSLFEMCFACCSRNKDVDALLRAQDPLPECAWVNISGVNNPVNQVAEGAFRRLEQTSFGRPVWKQDPGELYLHFLPSACTTLPDCGPTAEQQLENIGPAWVVGPEVGKDVVIMFAHPPDNAGWLNGSYYSENDAEGLNLLANNSKGFAWYNPAFLASAYSEQVGVNNTWYEHYDVDLSSFGGNDTLWAERWFFPSTIEIVCSDAPLYRYATTAIVFDDATDFRKMSFPDVNGTIISRGNLEMVTAVGIQSSPILGRSRELQDEYSPATRIKFGVGWQSVRIDGTNDMLSVAFASRKLTYCAARRSVCEYSHPPPPEIAAAAGDRECYPLSPEQLDCPWPGGIPIQNHEYGVDGLLLPEKDHATCMSFFPADEWYYGHGSFESFGTDARCFGEVMEEFISIDDPSSVYSAETSPPYWGMGGLSSCPQTQQYLGETLDTPTDLCLGLLRAGCQDACLRDPQCVGARFFYNTYQCKKIWTCDLTVPKESFDHYEDMNKTSGGWTPSRWKKRSAERGVGVPELVVGAKLVVSDMPGRTLTVTERASVTEPCPRHLQIQDSDGFTTQRCDAWRAARNPLRVSWNMTATERYRVCLLDSTVPLPADGLGGRLTEEPVTLMEPLNITEASVFPVTVAVSDAAKLTGVKMVRIRDLFFAVTSVDSRGNVVGLDLPPSTTDSFTAFYPILNTSGVSANASSANASAISVPVVPVFGGHFNTSQSFDVRVPHGVYSLENITETLNREIFKKLEPDAFALQFRVQDPGAGLCGEVGHGTSHDIQKFHCAPASRYFELHGSTSAAPFSDSNASEYGSEDDHVQILDTSTILESLGFAPPAIAYTFARPYRTPIPPHTLQHQVPAGAAYMSSGYGHFSGFGKGGQEEEGWDGYVPPEFDIEPEPYTVWCHDGTGHQCRSVDCGCSSRPVLTASRIRGATRTQRGHEPESNALKIPSSADGIIVSTGNLEDIGVESAAMTGLRIDALTEHDNGLAAQVGGWLQFSACASLFGDSDCSLVTQNDTSIRLGTAGTLSLQSYHATSFWIAIYNGSAELHAAAIVQDTHKAWELLPSELSSVNRTFAAKQDVLGVESAETACTTYCDELTLRQRREAEYTTQFLADAEHRMPASVWRTSRDTQSFCTIVQCDISGEAWSVEQFEDPLYECSQTASCGHSPNTLCSCGVQERCNQIWQGPRPSSLAAANPWTHADNWELCVRSVVLEKNLTNFCPCEGFNYSDPNARPVCCRNFERLGEEEILLDKATDAAESFNFFVNYEFMVGWEVVQWRETHQVCNCIEMEGFTDNVNASQEAVMNHVCAVGDIRYPSPVCEGEGGSFSLGANGSTTTTFLHVERPPEEQSNYLTIPAAHGVVLTTGNLAAVTKESGSMSSVHVMDESLFRKEIIIGAVGEQAASQGSRYDDAGQTTVYTDVNSSFCQGTQISDTAHGCAEPDLQVSLQPSMVQLTDGEASARVTSSYDLGSWNIDLPTWDDNLCVGEERSGCNPREAGLASFEGKIITTGNLKDVTAMAPNLVDTGGSTTLEGEVRLGSSQACHPDGYGLYGSSYTRFGWRAHTATQCVEAQDQVDWDDPTIVKTMGVKQCKQSCEDDPSCEILVVKIDVDRFPTSDMAKCILIAFPERKCTMASNPSQDTYLLQRKAPSPWLETIADEQFFQALCSDRFNASHIPGTPITLDGYLQGEIIWRARAPMSWQVYPHSQCDSFQGFSVGASSVVLENVTVDECKAQCEASADCAVVTFQPEREIQVMVEIANPNCTAVNSTNGTLVSNVTNLANATRANETAAMNCSQTMMVIRHEILPARCALDPLVSDRRVLSDHTVQPGLCSIVSRNGTDLHIHTRNENLKLSFANPTAQRQLQVSDSTGVIITTGNTHDMDRNIGSTGQDSWIISHPVTAAVSEYDLDERVQRGDQISDFSGVSEGVLIRNCFQNGLTCDVFASVHVSDEDLQREIETHLTSRFLSVNRLVRGEGDGFDQLRTIVDFAVPGSRTSGECFGECKGALTCERGTTGCNSDCPGYMAERPGVDMSLPCTASGSRGEVCGCANGEAFGQFGTSVCVMRNSTHPDHGRFCATTTPQGEYEFLFDCCYDRDNCGDCVTFPPQKPVGRSNRITFPQATGVVVTTGNIDDVVLKNIQLEGLDLIGFVDFGIGYPGDPSTPTLGSPDGYRYDRNQDQARAHMDLHPVSTRVTGGLRLVSGFGAPTKLYGADRGLPEIPGTAGSSFYTHLFIDRPTFLPEPLPQHAERYCAESVAFTWRDAADPLQQSEERDQRARCEYKREILIPPTSGTLLTAEHLDDVPAIAIPVEGLLMTSLNSSFIVEGNLTFGKVVNYTTDPFNNGGYGIPYADRVKQSSARLYNQFDGDVGLTMQSAASKIPLRPSTQGLSSLSNYGENVVGEAPYDDDPFSGPYPFGGPAPAQVIEDFARDGRKGDGEERSYALDYVRVSMPQGGGVDTAARTYLRGGAPSLPISVQDARSVPSEPNQLSDHFAYRSGQPVLQQRSITMPSASDSYSPAVDGSPRTANQALHGSTPINVTWCYTTLVNMPAVDPSSNVAGVRTLSMFMSFMVERGFLVPTLLTGDLLHSGPNTSDPHSFAANAFDADLSTGVGLPGRCLIELDLGVGNEAAISFIRYAASAGFEADLVGGKFQGSNDNITYTDLVEIVDLPLAPVYITATNYQGGTYRFLRYIGPPSTDSCNIAEIEFHKGERVIVLSELQHGRVSWRVDEGVLFRRENVEAAMLVKCAAHGMIPSMLENNIQEIILPEAQGQIITSGNLADISLDKGSFTSVNIAGDLEVDGSMTLGVPGQEALLTINSRLDSSSFFAFGGPAEDAGPSTTLLTNAMFEDAITSMPDVSGTLVVGELPSVMGDVLVMAEGGLDLDWNANVLARLQLGVVNQAAAPGSVEINALISAARPLALDGAFDGGEAISLGVPDPSTNAIVTLPDASGTVVTSATMPRVIDNVTAIDTELKGNVFFQQSDLEIGAQGGNDGMSMHADILGLGALHFDGTTRKDGRTLTLTALDPDADSELTLPDTTGTVITSANFPRQFDSLRSLDEFQVKGAASHTGELLTVGVAGGRSRLSVRAQINGRAPLLFDGGLRGAALASRRTSFLMPDSSRDNLITFPDVSGTVVTTANQPARIVTEGRYTVDAVYVTVSADTLLLGLGVVDKVEAGSFVFSDLLAKQHDHRPDRANQFASHCSGGAVFVTGETPKGKATGATLAAKASAWSYVSDREAKEVVAAVNGSEVLAALRAVEVTRWRYDVREGEGAEHLGPMAQAMYDAFGLGGSRERIGVSDADGVTLAAVHGLNAKIEALQSRLAEGKAALRAQEELQREQEAALARRRAAMDAQRLRLQQLWVAAQARGLGGVQ